MAIRLTSGATRHSTTVHAILDNEQSPDVDVRRWLDLGVDAAPDARARAVLHLQDLMNGQSITGKVAYYPVDGVTKAQIRGAMDAARGRYIRGDFDAITEWRIHYHYTPSTASAPGTSKFTVDESIVITLPELANRKSVDPALADAWDDFSRHLLYHEEGHYLIDEATIVALRARVAHLPGNTPFNDVDALCKRTMDEYSAMNKEYDSVTDHGVTQGASF